MPLVAVLDLELLAGRLVLGQGRAVVGLSDCTGEEESLGGVLGDPCAGVILAGGRGRVGLLLGVLDEDLCLAQLEVRMLF